MEDTVYTSPGHLRVGDGVLVRFLGDEQVVRCAVTGWELQGHNGRDVLDVTDAAGGLRWCYATQVYGRFQCGTDQCGTCGLPFVSPSALTGHLVQEHAKEAVHG